MSKIGQVVISLLEKGYTMEEITNGQVRISDA